MIVQGWHVSLFFLRNKVSEETSPIWSNDVEKSISDHKLKIKLPKLKKNLQT